MAAVIIPPWSHFMANENIQMIYWHALSGDCPSGAAYAAYYEGLMDDFRENARKLLAAAVSLFQQAPHL